MKTFKYYILWINHAQPGVQDYSEFDGTYEECVEYIKKENRVQAGGAIIAQTVYKIEKQLIENQYFGPR